VVTGVLVWFASLAFRCVGYSTTTITLIMGILLLVDLLLVSLQSPDTHERGEQAGRGDVVAHRMIKARRLKKDQSRSPKENPKAISYNVFIWCALCVS
jgi:hypothetical protein